MERKGKLSLPDVSKGFDFQALLTRCNVLDPSGFIGSSIQGPKDNIGLVPTKPVEFPP